MVFLDTMVADPDSSSKYCSRNENKYENKIENEVCVVRNDCDYPISELYQCEPRLEIVRSDIIAQRMVTRLIEYCPCLPIISNDWKINYLLNAKYNDVEYVSNSIYSKEKECEGEWYDGKKSKIHGLLGLKDNDCLSDICHENTIVLSPSSCKEKVKEAGRDSETHLEVVAVDTVLENSSNSIIEPIDETISSISSNVTPSKINISALSRSELEISRKYSLDATDMSLIYSLTPFMNSDGYVDKATLDESLMLSSFTSERLNDTNENCYLRSNEGRSLAKEAKRWNKKDSLNKKTDDHIPFDISYESESDELSQEISPEIVNNDMDFDDRYSEICNNEGSDILELSTVTISELFETADASLFEKDFSSTLNEIIGEVGISDTYMTIYCLINEIFQKVYDTLSNIGLNDRYSSLPSSMSKDLTSSALYLNMNDNDLAWKGKKTYHANESTQSVVVIHEIVHHVVDTCVEFKERNVELKEKGNCDIIEMEIGKVGQGVSNLSVRTNGDESVKDSRRQMQMEFDNRNEQADTETRRKIGQAMEADAIFEFRTITKNKRINTGDKTLELNFRVEKNRNVEMSVESNENNSYQGNIGKVKNSFISLLNPAANFANAINVEEERNLNNSLEHDRRKAELTERCKLCNIAKSSKPLEKCVDCVYCVKLCTMNYSQGCPLLLPRDEEKSDEMIINLNERNEMKGRNDKAEVREDRYNDTYACYNTNEMENDEELSSHGLENTENIFSSETTSLNDQASLLF